MKKVMYEIRLEKKNGLYDRCLNFEHFDDEASARKRMAEIAEAKKRGSMIEWCVELWKREEYKNPEWIDFC